jgi:hypothetical protein
MYALLYWKFGKNGHRPDLPSGVSFLLLADPGRGAEFGLFDVKLQNEQSLPSDAQIVSAELKELIDCSKRYAPALALARDDVSEKGHSTPDAFLAAYQDRLRDHLRQQPVAGYFLAEVVEGETGYTSAGGFCWIVSYTTSDTGGTVGWVSDDYFVYHDPTSKFRLDALQTAALTRLQAG